MTKKRTYNNPFQATLSGIKDLYKKQKPDVAIDEEARLDGKTVLITGASSGLGLATTVELAKRGARIITAQRKESPEEYRDKRSIYYYPVDLSDFESIDHLLEELQADNVHVDIFINNAAMVPFKSRKTKQDLEEMFMVNYLAPFYLMNRLLNLGLIKNSADDLSKIIIVSSESHRGPEGYEWDKFGKFVNYGMNATVARYGLFKLYLTTFANALARKLNESNEGMKISVRVLCPGPINSEIARESPALLKPLLKLVFGIFFKTPQQAMAPVIYFATENDNKSQIMDYLFLMNRKSMDERAMEVENGERLWKGSEDLIREFYYQGFRGI